MWPVTMAHQWNVGYVEKKDYTTIINNYANFLSVMIVYINQQWLETMC